MEKEIQNFIKAVSALTPSLALTPFGVKFFRALRVNTPFGVNHFFHIQLSPTWNPSLPKGFRVTES